MSLLLRFGTPPEDTAIPEDLTALLQLLQNYGEIIGDEQLTGVVVGSSTPSVDQQSLAWLKLASSGRPLYFAAYNGDWEQLPVILPGHTTASLPDEPQEGELILRTDRGDAIEAYIGGAWQSVRPGRVATADRPTSVPNGYRCYDTTIEKELRWVASESEWTTVESGLNEIKMFFGVTIASLLEQWPGWEECTEMADKFPMGQSGDHAIDTSGGRESFNVKLKRQGVNTAAEATVVGTLNVDASELTSPDTDNSAYGTDTEVSVLNPYRAVAMIKKVIH